MAITLTDGGIETRIIYEFKRPIRDFGAFELLEAETGREILRRIYQSYVDVAARYALPIQLGTPTWRASRKWTRDVARVNAAAVELVREVARRAAGVRVIVAGVIGPASDGYATGEALGADAALAYHREQAEALAARDVDLLYAPTFPAFSELQGAARAMAATGRPYALAPMLHPDGTMLDGRPLAAAIAGIDTGASPAPGHYMIGCLYPTHAHTALQALRAARPELVARVRGLKANASPLSPEELEKLTHLAATDAPTWARDEVACAREFELTILGGCCGTDQRHIAALAAEASVPRD
jgi:S-methylmethionine-dependent homocysteine/selenocysteine methylase